MYACHISAIRSGRQALCDYKQKSLKQICANFSSMHIRIASMRKTFQESKLLKKMLTLWHRTTQTNENVDCWREQRLRCMKLYLYLVRFFHFYVCVLSIEFQTGAIHCSKCCVANIILIIR